MKKITQILFLGDSQSSRLDYQFLRNKFQEKNTEMQAEDWFFLIQLPNLVSDDFTYATNQTWENFRLVYEQDVFPQMGVLVLVGIGNQQDSFFRRLNSKS